MKHPYSETSAASPYAEQSRGAHIEEITIVHNRALFRLITSGASKKTYVVPASYKSYMRIGYALIREGSLTTAQIRARFAIIDVPSAIRRLRKRGFDIQTTVIFGSDPGNGERGRTVSYTFRAVNQQPFFIIPKFGHSGLDEGQRSRGEP